MKKHNFNAGPCVLPRQAVESAIEAIRDFDEETPALGLRAFVWNIEKSY